MIISLTLFDKLLTRERGQGNLKAVFCKYYKSISLKQSLKIFDNFRYFIYFI